MSSKGARPKKMSPEDPQFVDRSILPDELRNNFYPDVLLIYSKEDAPLAQSFLTETQNRIKEHKYIVAGYLDKQVWINPTDGLPDYERCTAFMYLFTKKSVQDYHTVTKHHHLDALLYDGKFVPVLTEPEGDLDLPMSANVSCPLRYYKQQTSDWVHSVTEFLKKHADIRRKKEKDHRKKEQAFLDSIETDEPVTPINEQKIMVIGDNVIIGAGGKIVVNKCSHGEKGSSASHQCQKEFHGIPFKKEESFESSDVLDELGPPIRDSRGTSQTPCDSPASFGGKHKSYQSFQNRQSTQVEDFCSRRRESALNDRPLSGRLNDVVSNEMKQLPARNIRPVAKVIPTEASFPNLQFISNIERQEPNDDDSYTSRGTSTKCGNRPCPKEICGKMFSFSDIPDSFGPPSETNITMSDQQKRNNHADYVENLAPHDSLQSVLPGEGLSLGSLKDSD